MVLFLVDSSRVISCKYLKLETVECRTKAVTYDDFRGIAISPVISKVGLFENCLLDYFQIFLNSGDNQFGFKKGDRCSHVIQTVRNVADHYIKAGYTANLCAIDLSKAFDKINHHALYTTLMKRHVSNKLLLDILENWLCGSHACVTWANLWSYMFTINFGVRQGSVLSPVEHSNSGKKSFDLIRFDSRYRIDFFDSIRFANLIHLPLVH